MRMAKLLKGLTLAAALLAPQLALADSWYPSPTGWRGPIRDAGRPWLRGTPYEPPGYYRTDGWRSYYAPAYYQASVWYYDMNTSCYWLYDAAAGLYWYYTPATGMYYYSYAYH